MRRMFHAIRDFVEKADMILLLLCVGTTIFGIVVIASATNYLGYGRFVTIQAAALCIGLVLYVLFTILDIDIIAERRDMLFLFNMLFLSSLFLWGTDNGTGNRSWLAFSWLPFSIQPAEICKITFIIIMSRMMFNAGDRLSSPLNIGKLTLHLLLTIGVILVASKDAGNALVFVFIFLVLAYTGGVRLGWFAIGGAVLAVILPTIWTQFMQDYQRNRVLMLFDPSIDPNGTGVRWQTSRSLMYLQSGGLAGDGLFQGTHTQSGLLPAQHTDFIFSVIGEELGLLGCVVALLLLTAIVVRIIYVGMRANSYMNRMICIGIASMLLFQILVDVGMCIGVFPVIGLTLPFLSYGGSSIVTLFAAMGIVSGIKMRPAPNTNARYIQKQG